MNEELNGRVAVVTGGAGGIGKAICLRLAASGATVVIAGRNMQNANRLVEEVESTGGTAIAIKTDVTSPEEVQALATATLERFGQIHILINNAGIRSRNAPLWELDYEEWKQVMAVDLDSVFLCCKYMIPSMIKQGQGRIINVASTYGVYGAPNQTAYSAAKAGIITLTKSISAELAPYNVLAHSVISGFIEAGMGENVPALEREQAIKRIPLGRPGRPEEVAELIAILASDRLTFTTGASWDQSGGRGG